MWKVSKEFHFDAAHSLPHLPPAHKCHHLHGHTYTVVVHCRGDLQLEFSWVVDYAEIKAAVEPLIAKLDHPGVLVQDIINVPSTAENLAFWLYRQLIEKLPTLYQVDVHETTGTCCSYCPRP